MPVPVRFKRLSPRAVEPRYHSDQAAGMDLSACLPEGETVTLQPGQIVKVSLGFAVALPVGYEAQIRPRSGLATRHGVTVPNAPGTVDSDYRGEMVVALINLGREPFTVEHGLRVAQMVVAPVSHAELIEVEELDETARGAGGFGSTGL
ncbi:MAG: dUTP diphosphatase [Phycisphaerales bacterium]|nr:dUTP diphosphatase [Phycisphaerales bacterium]